MLTAWIHLPKVSTRPRGAEAAAHLRQSVRPLVGCCGTPPATHRLREKETAEAPGEGEDEAEEDEESVQ